MDRHQLIFFEEARDLLTELEEATLAIEHDPVNMELIGRIFRAIHTLKGSSSMFGCDSIAHFVHDFETVFDAVRRGELAVSPPLITLTLASRDHIAVLIQDLLKEQQSDAAVLEHGNEILSQLRTLLPGNESLPPPISTHAEASAPDPVSNARSVMRVRFRPPRNIFLTGSNPHFLIDELKEMGDAEVVVHADAQPPEEEKDPDLCYSRWDVLLLTTRDEHAIRDVFIFVEDESELRIERLGDAELCTCETRRDLVSALTREEDASIGMLTAILTRRHSQPQAPAAHIDADHADRRPDHKNIQSIKVPSERLDKLVDLVGELVIVQARLSQAAAVSPDSGFGSIAESVEALVWELRDTAMSIRMLPIGTTFGKFNRLVRDLSAELGKEIALVTEGEETELDKTVIERLSDPLVHMIRNCIDHGIETPADRIAAGKSRAGTITLSAAHTGAFVQISITDDGRGLDTAAIFAKAAAQGLVGPDEQLTPQELYALIFRPGFSTKDAVTNISGRGVGMDVVKRSIDDLGGQLDVHSTLHAGTTIVMKIPLTLAIVEGLLVQVGKEYYIIPLSIVKECVELPGVDERRGSGGELINVRGEIVPYIRLHEYFMSPDPVARHEYVVIVESAGTALGVAVDAVCGEHQTVIKSLGAVYSGVKGVSGATILGDGTVALIVDIPSIAAEVRQEQLGAFA